MEAVGVNGLGGGKWFSEVNDFWHGQAFSLKIKEILHHEQSKYQDIQVLERYGGLHFL